LTVIKIDPLISSSIYNEIYRLAEKEKENTETWKGYIKNIDKYFE
jgi:rRNA-processing protein FCF1